MASPVGGGSNCGVIAGDGSEQVGPLDATSTGYRYDTDGTCGVGAATGDVSAGTDPTLSALANHGGPTLTRQPLRGSRLLDAIPSADPSCTGVDQRNRPRPAGIGCDIGAVEARFRR